MGNRIAVAVVVSLAFAACRAPESKPEPAPASFVDAEALARVAELEDARAGGVELARFLSHRQALVRQRAATALGRLWFPEEDGEVTRALLGALFDADPGVRADAAFALGVRGDPSAADKLVFVALDEHEKDRDPLVRARAIEAASKLDRPELRERLLDGLLDTDPRVRLEAAVAPQRWPATDPDAAAIDRRLVEHLAGEKHRRVVTYALAALERRKSEAAREVFLRFAKSEDAEQRIFAVRGLARISPNDTARDALIAATQDADWRVACEAVLGLGNYADEASYAALGAARRHALPHVRRCALEGIAAFTARGIGAGFDVRRAAALVDLGAYDAEPSASVRAAAIEAHGRGLGVALHSSGAAGETPVEEALAFYRDWVAPLGAGEPSVRVALARVWAGLAGAPGVAAAGLRELARDADPSVAGAAIEGLGKLATPESRAALHGFLAHSDNGLRLAAVNALAEMPDASDVEPLARCYETSNGDGASEIRFSVLRALGKIGGEGAKGAIALGAADPSPFVRRVATEEAKRLGLAAEPRALAPKRPGPPPELPPIDTTINAPEPRVEIVTSRGEMVFELFPREAPVHVHNFLALAERGHYDGLTFHRVVPDFVIQGGDYRGDGNGGGTWRARDDALRHEFTPRKFERGSLGMPRNDDPDSGGSQFFVTHRATPHLDGRYTLFGELREGGDVLDSIEVGDKIVRVRRLP
jgi:cyclophilin family peptidyl-prolyl cis-trans isomerase